MQENNVNYIGKNEIDGEVSPVLINMLNRFIRGLRSVFKIYYFTKGTHSKKSMHSTKPGKAADGQKGKFDEKRKPTSEDIQFMATELNKIVNKPDKTLFEEAVIAKLAGATGIGMYPDWTPAPGLHLDIRDKDKALTWIGLNKEKAQEKIDETSGSQVYFYLV